MQGHYNVLSCAPGTPLAASSPNLRIEALDHLALVSRIEGLDS
ncbi:hypothetical protein [Rhodanobacter sp. DHB23]|nr:hypothetical protein [Rhodanobacter sp. DHB23]